MCFWLPRLNLNGKTLLCFENFHVKHLIWLHFKSGTFRFGWDIKKLFYLTIVASWQYSWIYLFCYWGKAFKIFKIWKLRNQVYMSKAKCQSMVLTMNVHKVISCCCQQLLHPIVFTGYSRASIHTRYLICFFLNTPTVSKIVLASAQFNCSKSRFNWDNNNSDQLASSAYSSIHDTISIHWPYLSSSSH